MPSVLAALVIGFAGNAVYAADDAKPTNEQKLQQQKDAVQEPAKQQTTGDLTEQEQAYLSALKKCEPMSGAEKQRCVDRTKQEFNHH
jgi:hypothetical protein